MAKYNMMGAVSRSTVQVLTFEIQAVVFFFFNKNLVDILLSCFW